MLAGKAAGVGLNILIRTGKQLTRDAQAEASVVLDSIADVPAYLRSIN